MIWLHSTAGSFPVAAYPPWARLLFTFEKTYLTPARLVHFLGVLLAFAPLYAVLVPRIGRIAGYPRIPSGLAGFAVAGNASSGAVILPMAFTGVLPLTNLGIAFMVAGALWVLTFATLSFVGLRRSRSLS